MATVIVGADICPIGNNLPHFLQGDPNSLFHDLLPSIQRADVAIANLECPLTDRLSPIPKTGPSFAAPPACANTIAAAGFKVIGLANNHIMDHGSDGLGDTVNACEAAGIQVVGVGANEAEARRILITPVGGIRLGILAVAENEFSTAGPRHPGANPLNIRNFVRDVQSRRGEMDFLVVLFHGGDEFHVPSPAVQDTCRFFVEMGAAAVVVQHPHALGGIETYLGCPIVYGQGALIMDEEIYRDRGSFHQGFLLKLELRLGQRPDFAIVPFVQSFPDSGARRLSAGQEVIFRKELESRSARLLDPLQVDSAWVEFCRRKSSSYLSGLLGFSRFLRRLNRTGLVSRAWLTRRARLRARNLFTCETHREAMETILKQELG